MKRFRDSLEKIEAFKLINDTSARELIVYADDEKSNREQMISQCSKLGLAHRLVIFENGQSVVDYFKQQVGTNELVANRSVQ